jgi:membrane-associated phospholipid phosphatase
MPPQTQTETQARGAATRGRGLSFPGWWPLVVQIALVVMAAAAYFLVRGVTEGALETAQANARTLVELEAMIGLKREGLIQAGIDHDHTLVTLANWVYIYGHWPVIVVSLVWLFLRAPDRFFILRNALFISGAIGLVFFVSLPVAPPRLDVLELTDTVTQFSDSYRTLQPPAFTNAYAAFPSLHFGFNLLVGITIWQATRNPFARAFAVVMPLAMAWAVVATANHYVIDVLAGAAVALVGLALSVYLARRYGRPEWARPPE